MFCSSVESVNYSDPLKVTYVILSDPSRAGGFWGITWFLGGTEGRSVVANSV